MKNVTEKLEYSLGDYFSPGKRIMAVNCLQFGDTGKGKFVDIFADWADIIVRCTGGDNAGHTIICNGKEKIFHLIPSGIVHDIDGKTNVIGRGTVIYPKTLIGEISLLQSEGIPCKHLKISKDAKVITSYHILIDRLSESRAGLAKIGTTGKGIGPCYADFIARRGISINDLLNPAIFRRKLAKNMEHVSRLLQTYSYQDIDAIMAHEHLEFGKYSNDQTGLDFEAIVNSYLAYGAILQPYVCNTDEFLQDECGRSNILLEGAQGYLLSVDYGTYPYVTSSDCSVQGLMKGAGLEMESVGVPFGIIKGLYMTRVGAGPFPTEMGGKDSADWCNNVGTRDKEKELYADSDINDPDEFIQGVAIRRKGHEYGATTTRPRRTGWLDLPLLRHSLRSEANQIIMTKLDVLTGVKIIKICCSYEYQGEDYIYGDKLIKRGDIVETAIVDPYFLDYCVPIYVEFPGWDEDIRGIRKYADLPETLKNILEYIFVEVEAADLRIISVGPGPEETIFVGEEELYGDSDWEWK